jgi:hypothetical protein
MHVLNATNHNNNMKLLLISAFLFLSIKSFAQDFIQRTSKQINDHYYDVIQNMNKVYEYDSDNISIELFQEDIDLEENDWSLPDGSYSLIKINEYFLPFQLGYKNKFELMNLVSGELPEIILYSEFYCQEECGIKTYIINLEENKPFVVSDLGTYVTIIQDSGEINYYDEDTGLNQTYQYNFNKGENMFFVYESMLWDDEGCSDIIRTINYKKGQGYSKGEIKKKIKTICAACFTADMMVSISDAEKKPISSLQPGDNILTYDFDIGEEKIVSIESIISVPHSTYVEYYFSHDTITATLDHPFYLYEKGWSSFDSEATQTRYKNYTDVNTILVGDVFFLRDGRQAILNGYKILKTKMDSFTITKLSHGDCFYVNDVLVGIEEFYIPKNWRNKISQK